MRWVGFFGWVRRRCVGLRERHGFGGAVEKIRLRCAVANVGGDRVADAVSPPMLGGVRGDAEVQTAGACGAGEFTDDVAVWAHFDCIVGRHGGGVHREAVAVLGYRNDVAGARFDEEIDPGVGIEVLCAEERDEVLVAEFFERTMQSDLVLVGRISWDVHVARVPLVSECRNGVDAPVKKDADLRIAKPVGCAVGGERVPGSVKRNLGVVLCCFRADFRDLRGDVAREFGRRTGLGEERGSDAQNTELANNFQGDTIAEAA